MFPPVKNLTSDLKSTRDPPSKWCFEFKNCNFSKKCIKRINETQLIETFDKFWNIGDLNKISIEESLKIILETMWVHAHKFYLVTSGGNILVCKKFVIDILRIFPGRIDCTGRSLNKISSYTSVYPAKCDF